MAKRAVLSVWDPVKEAVVEIEITWDKGFDKDAKVMVPVRFKKQWAEAARVIRSDNKDEGKVEPYATLLTSVSLENLTRSATGAYAIAREIFRGVGWSVPPPYPVNQETTPEGVTP